MDEEELAAAQLDVVDDELLASLRSIYDGLDPVPEGLVDRVRFGLALDEVYAEVATLTREPLDAMAVRGEADAGTRVQTLTFSAENLTVMVTITHTDEGVRIDGWVAPAGPITIRVRHEAGVNQATADETGRFVIDELPEGFAQLSFRPAPAEGTGRGTASGSVEGVGSDGEEGVIVTPLFQL